MICHDTLKSHKTVFIVLISLKMTQFKTLFHIRSNLLCLVCQCVVSSLFGMATVTKESGSFRTVNCELYYTDRGQDRQGRTPTNNSIQGKE